MFVDYKVATQFVTDHTGLNVKKWYMTIGVSQIEFFRNSSSLETSHDIVATTTKNLGSDPRVVETKERNRACYTWDLKNGRYLDIFKGRYLLTITLRDNKVYGLPKARSLG